MARAIVYEDFEPFCFKKDQLKIPVNNLGVMIIAGERPLEGISKRSRFQKELRLSKGYKINEIHAKLSRGILSIYMPKKTTASSSSLSFQDNERKPQNTIPDNTAFEMIKTIKLSLGYRVLLPVAIGFAFVILLVVGAFVLNCYNKHANLRHTYKSHNHIVLKREEE
ncbi:hypothetical protein P3X46_008198 [Hevea brasiliensis]|uniref:SHSP domain-containing protein n=1 Tax=Hevea brasiliensis TaxID=3981 RepID=A0ABQ9MHS0_HEVBR|nr:hypothetical protein P3X46_008198 [Hevea brasiliensis]